MSTTLKTTNTDMRKTGLFNSPTTSLRPVGRDDAKNKSAVKRGDNASERRAKEEKLEAKRQNAKAIDEAIAATLK